MEVRTQNPKTSRIDYQIIELEVDHKQSVDDLVDKLGQKFVLARLFQNETKTTLSLSKSVRFVLVSHAEMVDSETVIADMNRHSIRPATIQELLLFCFSCCLLNKVDLVALGSKTHLSNFEQVYFVPMYRPGYLLSLNDTRYSWPRYARFLGIFEF